MGPAQELRKDEAIEDFGKGFARMHNLRLLIVGDTTDSTKYKPYAISLMSHQEISLQEGRNLGVLLVGDFLKMLQKNRAVSGYLKWASSESPYRAAESEPSLQTVGVKISFWNMQMERPQAPSLAQICFYDDTFYFYEADPEKEVLRLVGKESFEEAAKA
jgi:hypothetical protein